MINILKLFSLIIILLRHSIRQLIRYILVGLCGFDSIERQFELACSAGNISKIKKLLQKDPSLSCEWGLRFALLNSRIDAANLLVAKCTDFSSGLYGAYRGGNSIAISFIQDYLSKNTSQEVYVQAMCDGFYGACENRFTSVDQVRDLYKIIKHKVDIVDGLYRACLVRNNEIACWIIKNTDTKQFTRNNPRMAFILKEAQKSFRLSDVVKLILNNTSTE